MLFKYNENLKVWTLESHEEHVVKTFTNIQGVWTFSFWQRLNWSRVVLGLKLNFSISCLDYIDDLSFNLYIVSKESVGSIDRS